MLPILTQIVVDRVLPHHDLRLLWILMGAIVAVLLAITGATLVQRYLLSLVAVRFDVATLDFLTEPPARPADELLRDAADRRHRAPARAARGRCAQFFIQSGVQALTSATQLARGARADVRLQLDARARLPRDGARRTPA